MPIPAWIKSVFSRPVAQPRAVAEKTSKPTPQEMAAAVRRLHEMAKPASLGQIGGRKPNKENRAASWWGGNFLGAKDEDVPVCNQTGRPMHPVLQIRVDELSEIPQAFQGLALVNIWMN